jgi:hypothetical protein
MTPDEATAIVREMGAFRVAVSHELGAFKTELADRMRGVEEGLKALQNNRSEDLEEEQRYRVRHDRMCDECETRLRGEITEAAAAAPFEAWINRYRVLVAVTVAVVIMFGRDLGYLLLRILASGG